LLTIITAAEFRLKSVLEEPPAAIKDDPELKDIIEANKACRAVFMLIMVVFLGLRDWIGDKQVYKRP